MQTMLRDPLGADRTKIVSPRSASFEGRKKKREEPGADEPANDEQFERWHKSSSIIAYPEVERKAPATSLWPRMHAKKAAAWLM